jgi:hypothetical protein
VATDALEHERFNLGRGHAPDAASFALPLLQDGMRYIVPVTDTTLVGVRRAHAVAPVIEDATDQNGRRASELGPTIHGVFSEPGLHGLEQLPLNDRLMSAGMDRATIGDLANVKAVLEQMSKCTGPKADAAPYPAVDKPSCLGADIAPIEVLDQGANGSKLEIAGKDCTDRHRFIWDRDDLLVGDPVAQRHSPPTQMPLRLEAAILSRTRSPMTSRSN